MSSTKNLSVIIPVYNERKSIATIIAKVALALPDVSKEIIIVDDGSLDGTRDWLSQNIRPGDPDRSRLGVGPTGDLIFDAASVHAPVRLRALYHERNQGKGRALRTGFAVASGHVVVVQDADLEYDPADWAPMYDLIALRKVADVVFGSRFYGRPHRALYFHHYMGNRLISLLFNLLFNQTLTDVEVCYKMFSLEVLRTLQLSSDDFGIEIELSARIARRRSWRIYELGISYYGRTYQEGKKIGWKDGLKALWYLIRFRLW
jgi:glycosyltransferase involved in cell wall biosynthesis